MRTYMNLVLLVCAFCALLSFIKYAAHHSTPTPKSITVNILPLERVVIMEYSK